jgi:hypothetical protein
LAIDFENWWSMWKTHVFWKALGPMLQQIHAEYEVPEEEILPSIHRFFLLTLLNSFSNSICSFCSRSMVQSPGMMMDLTSSLLPPWFFSVKTHLPLQKASCESNPALQS